jgi:ADP-ribosylglycohydrolase
VGDALGAPVEFDSRATIDSRFGAAGIRDFAPAYGRVGAITDDTQMTLFTAEGLMRAQNRMRERGICHPPSVIWHAYARWLQTQGGEVASRDPPFEEMPDGWLFHVSALHAGRAPGNTCLGAITAGRMGSPDTPINDSKGCGGVMRAAPAGVLPPGNPFDSGCEVAALTHGHPAGYLTAGYLASVINALLDGHELSWAATRARAELEKHVLALGPALREKGEECSRAVDRALTLSEETPASADGVELLGAGWVAEEALAIALYCALGSSSFEEGVILAVNHGGDSDSTGAIAGNILGAQLGPDAIPNRWLAALELRAEIETVAEDLARHRSRECYAELDSDYLEVPKEEMSRYPGW